MRGNHIILICLVLITKFSFGQSIVDSCFTSVNSSTNFISSGDLVNMSTVEADVIEWTGSGWTGGWPDANLTIPPPTNSVGCRAIFIGNATTWTSGGEGFGLRLNSPLIAGQTYSFVFNYVSHGAGSDGAFSPGIYTNPTPALGYFVGNLPAVGYTWTMNTFSFTATAAQTGHTWIIITTAPSGSSGLINSFCNTCNDTSAVNCSVNLGNDTTLCQGDALILNATTSNATYQWQDNSTNPTYTVSQQGTYWVKVTVNNCIATDTINVSYNPLPMIGLGNDTTLCQGDALILNATTSNATYQWQDNSTNPTYTVSQQGTYWVKVTVNNCIATDTINVSYNPLPVIGLGNDTTLCQGDALILNATTSNATYQWQDNSTNPTYTVSQQGTYWVKVTVNNCSMADTLKVESKNCEIIIEMPNVFTPNNDGVNDYFYPIELKGITHVTLGIYNRWGQKLIETNNILTGWDGKYNGQVCTDGTYFWIIRYTTITNESKVLTGFLTLIK
jgi:gliding motility-associated-like protein